MKRPFIIGIAGPTGSGKSTLAASLMERLPGTVGVMHLDDYFVNPALMPLYEGEHNWDDPRAIDEKRLLKDLRGVAGKSSPYSVIIVEGFLVLHFARIRKMLDFRIFLSAPIGLSLGRRVHDAHDHYRTHVIPPMNEKYVVPSAKYADYIFDARLYSQDRILQRVLSMLPELQAVSRTE